MVYNDSSARQWKLVFVILFLILITLLISVLSVNHSSDLMVIACNVGQGDSLLIQKGNTQIIVDGGPGNKAVDCLSRYMPFWDRNIELAVLTHPQADHYEGLIEVFKRYEVNYFLANEAGNITQGYKVLKEKVGGMGTKVLNPNPSKDMGIGLIYLDILFPDKPINPSDDLNNYSVVFNLRYKNFSMLFTGDIGPEINAEILAAGLTDVDVLKVPHHGSKNGLTEQVLNATKPEIAIISVGEKNRYGHPHEEILQMLGNNKVKILRTDKSGDIIIRTDGDNIYYK